MTSFWVNVEGPRRDVPAQAMVAAAIASRTSARAFTVFGMEMGEL